MTNDITNIEYTPEQMAAINAALADQDTLDGFVSYEQSERIVDVHGSTFAVFGYFAYGLFRQDAVPLCNSLDDPQSETGDYVPVILDGKAFGRFPDEGESGILHLFRVNRGGNPGNWNAYYLGLRWSHTVELPA